MPARPREMLFDGWQSATSGLLLATRGLPVPWSWWRPAYESLGAVKLTSSHGRRSGSGWLLP